ncbi:MAG: F0F1 ATP synthase subunit gamma [Candidatus Omnitrophica bacterium]|nr:F0F1 ATP synthase subunit gamma [Candidatus Omnitrophota bacterium]
MRSIARLKNDLSFNKTLEEMIDILKITTAVQLRRLQDERKREGRFLSQLHDSFSILKKGKAVNHPFFQRDREEPCCIVVITSDEGFLGELNSLLMNTALKEKNSGNDTLIVLGERGANYLDGLQEPYLFFSGIGEKVESSEADNLKRYLSEKYLKGQFNRVLIVYAEFVSISVQQIKVHMLLPVPVLELPFSPEDAGRKEEIIIEPSSEAIIEGLMNLNLNYTIYNIFYSSKLSEFSARLMHLEKSSQELVCINRKLFLEYYKNLHFIADKRIREVLAARTLIRK